MGRPGATATELSPPPSGYLERQARHIRNLAMEGRGDDARGRNLATLYVLEWSYARGQIAYRPRRDTSGWLIMLADVAGARAGLGPADRMTLPFHEFQSVLDAIGLAHVARQTGQATYEALAKRFGLPPLLVEPFANRMTLASVLWHLGHVGVRKNSPEKHPQARHLRKLLRSHLDDAWDASLCLREHDGHIGELELLAALPLSFGVASRVVQAALDRVGEDLASVPFAVFYALLTDARRGGRVWRPPDRYVEATAYSRSTFEAAVGHALVASRSRRRRYARSVALSELGLSALFPRTIARLDAWLETHTFPTFFVASADGQVRTEDWYSWAVRNGDEIERLHARHAQGLGIAPDAPPNAGR